MTWPPESPPPPPPPPGTHLTPDLAPSLPPSSINDHCNWPADVFDQLPMDDIYIYIKEKKTAALYGFFFFLSDCHFSCRSGITSPASPPSLPLTFITFVYIDLQK
ncbi:unnamed protein product [Arctogadus glacialis]